MTKVMVEGIEDTVVVLGAATEASLQHTFERASERKNPPKNYDAFVEYVIDRGIAEIERTWKAQAKASERNDLVKKYLDTVKFLKAKQAHGEELTTEQLAVLSIFNGQ